MIVKRMLQMRWLHVLFCTTSVRLTGGGTWKNDILYEIFAVYVSTVIYINSGISSEGVVRGVH